MLSAAVKAAPLTEVAGWSSYVLRHFACLNIFLPLVLNVAPLHSLSPQSQYTKPSREPHHGQYTKVLQFCLCDDPAHWFSLSSRRPRPSGPFLVPAHTINRGKGPRGRRWRNKGKGKKEQVSTAGRTKRRVTDRPSDVWDGHAGVCTSMPKEEASTRTACIAKSRKGAEFSRFSGSLNQVLRVIGLP